MMRLASLLVSLLVNASKFVSKFASKFVSKFASKLDSNFAGVSKFSSKFVRKFASNFVRKFKFASERVVARRVLRDAREDDAPRPRVRPRVARAHGPYPAKINSRTNLSTYPLLSPILKIGAGIDHRKTTL